MRIEFAKMCCASQPVLISILLIRFVGNDFRVSKNQRPTHIRSNTPSTPSHKFTSKKPMQRFKKKKINAKSAQSSGCFSSRSIWDANQISNKNILIKQTCVCIWKVFVWYWCPWLLFSFFFGGNFVRGRWNCVGKRIVYRYIYSYI